MAPRAEERSLNSIEKAAVVLMMLGQKYGADIWENLEDEEVRLVTNAIANLGTVNPSLADEVLVEFAQGINSFSIRGDYQNAQTLLKGLLPDDRLDSVIADLGAPKGRTIWQKMANVQEEIIASHLRTEHPQATALILSKLRPAQAAKVLSHLDGSLAAEVMNRIIITENISNEAFTHIEESLKSNFIANLSQTPRRNPHDLLAEILNSLDSQMEHELMSKLRQVNPVAADQVRAAMFTFDDLTRIDASSVQVLMSKLDKADLAKALKGAAQSTRDFFIKKMSQRAASIFIDDMQALGPTRLKDVDQAQQNILKIAKQLSEAGQIVIPKGTDDEMLFE